MKTRSLQGVLAVAFAYDTGRADAMRGVTGGQVGILADTSKRGQPPHPEVSAQTPGFAGDAAVAALAANATALDALFRKGQEVGPVDVNVGDDVRVLKAVPIKSAAGEPIGAIVVSRSRAEETAAFREIRSALVFIGLFALVVSLPVSLLMGRGIARPLEELARGA